jgi:outer membrane protein TolC
VGAQRIHALLVESATNFARTVEYHEIRVREGAMAEADLLRIRLESERLNLAATNALLEAERARIRLYREMGQADIPDQVEFEALAPPDGEAQTMDPRQALEERTEMKLARMEVEAAQSEHRLAEANSKPDIGLIAGYKRVGGYNSLLAGVEFGLPFFDRNQGSISAAAARIAAYRAEAASMAGVVVAEVLAAQKVRELRRQQITDSLEPMRRQAAESAEISQAAYREGGADLLRLLDAERLRIETETLYYEALASYHQSVSELEGAMGVEP